MVAAALSAAPQKLASFFWNCIEFLWQYVAKAKDPMPRVVQDCEYKGPHLDLRQTLQAAIGKTLE